MQPKLTRFFVCSASAILLATAAAKLISGLGSAEILQVADPILGISYRAVFLMTGIIELAVALVCLLGRKIGLQVGLMAWLATSFVVYRLGLLLIDYRKPCHCLGGVTDALHISPEAADMGMKIILGYFLIGSYLILFAIWKRRGKGALVPAPAHVAQTAD